MDSFLPRTPPPPQEVLKDIISPTYFIFLSQVSSARLSMELFSCYGRRFILFRQNNYWSNHIYACILRTFVRSENTKIWRQSDPPQGKVMGEEDAIIREYNREGCGDEEGVVPLMGEALEYV